MRIVHLEHQVIRNFLYFKSLKETPLFYFYNHIMESSGQSGIQLESLTLEQLQQLRAQVAQDIPSLEQLYLTLKSGREKFSMSREGLSTLATQKPDSEEVKKQSLMPLTSSLYVHGHIPEVWKVLVDVGAKYFIQMSPERAMKYYDSRCDHLYGELQKVSQALQKKTKEVQMIERVMMARAKMQEKTAATQE